MNTGLNAGVFLLLIPIACLFGLLFLRLVPNGKPRAWGFIGLGALLAFLALCHEKSVHPKSIILPTWAPESAMVSEAWIHFFISKWAGVFGGVLMCYGGLKGTYHEMLEKREKRERAKQIQQEVAKATEDK